MSVVTLQLGQCGNQLGFDLHAILAGELLTGPSAGASETFFREGRTGVHVARALLLDMEPKVVNSCINRSQLESSWRYDRGNVVLQQSGSGAHSHMFGTNFKGYTAWSSMDRPLKGSFR
jgi:tubulin delta